MNNKVRTPSIRENAANPIAAEGPSRPVHGILGLPDSLSDNAAIAALVAAADLHAFLSTGSGRTLLAELCRRARHRSPRPAAPSLRRTPTPADFDTDRDSLQNRLRLGSLLADRSATLDFANHMVVMPNGSRRIASRGPGVKGWLAENRIKTSYPTLMRYKQLALRLREVLRLDDRIPLEWLLPGTSFAPDVPEDLRPHHATARRCLAKLLREYPNVHRLRKHVNEILGIPHLPKPRRASSVPIDESLLGTVRCELLAFLRATDLSARQKKVRRSALEWLVSHS